MPYTKPGMMEFSDVGGHWSTAGLEPGPGEDEPGPFTSVRQTAPRPNTIATPASRPSAVRDTSPTLAAPTAGSSCWSTVASGKRFRPYRALCREIGASRGQSAAAAASHRALSRRRELLIVARDADGWGVERRDAMGVVSGSNIDPPDDDCRNMAVLAHGSFRRAEEAPVVAWFERLPGEAEHWRVLRNGAPIDDFLCTAPSRRQPGADADGRHIADARPRRAPRVKTRCSSKGERRSLRPLSRGVGHGVVEERRPRHVRRRRR